MGQQDSPSAFAPDSRIPIRVTELGYGAGRPRQVEPLSEPLWDCSMLPMAFQDVQCEHCGSHATRQHASGMRYHSRPNRPDPRSDQAARCPPG